MGSLLPIIDWGNLGMQGPFIHHVPVQIPSVLLFWWRWKGLVSAWRPLLDRLTPLQEGISTLEYDHLQPDQQEGCKLCSSIISLTGQMTTYRQSTDREELEPTDQMGRDRAAVRAGTSWGLSSQDTNPIISTGQGTPGTGSRGTTQPADSSMGIGLPSQLQLIVCHVLRDKLRPLIPSLEMEWSLERGCWSGITAVRDKQVIRPWS